VVARVQSPTFTLPASCKPETFDAEPCRKDLTDQIAKLLRTTTAEELVTLRRSILGTLESRGDVYAVQELYEDLTSAFDDVEDRMEEVAEQAAAKALVDLSKDKAGEAATQAAKAAAAEVDRVCREEAIDRVARSRTLAFRGAEDALTADLTKETGFSQIVRCQWQRRPEGRDVLDCKPGLRVTGQDAAAILILPPPNDPDFGVSWVQATTAEESRQFKANPPLSCPGYGPGDPRKLTCDEICFESGRACTSPRSRTAVPTLVEVAVHMPRLIQTSYGCAGGMNHQCALAQLRGTDDNPLAREKLSLLIRGKTPYIAVRAIDRNGRMASGSILVGYERWRIETGGFMAITGAVDEKVITEEAEDGEDGEVEVVEIREVDDYAQETGIFVSFIPRNFETIGVSLGFAAHDGEAPSVYLGPSLRLRSFGHRGLAALTLGLVMRPVDRFPDIDEGNVLASDSSKLQPDSQFELDGFVGIQLGFSFGPISSAADD
jgi:hypothetical protein